jgi:hypothetical protein
VERSPVARTVASADVLRRAFPGDLFPRPAFPLQQQRRAHLSAPSGGDSLRLPCRINSGARFRAPDVSEEQLMSHDNGRGEVPARRQFLKTAGVLAVGTATIGTTACDVKEPAVVDEQPAARRVGFDRALLDALAATVLPASLGVDGVRAATDRFVGWADAYDPVAEEMHGYGYADVRYLPADPVPAWRAQLDALDMLSRKSQRTGFASATAAQRVAVLEATLRAEPGDRLPSPLGARHVALALLAHWSASPEAWNLALGAQISPLSCRPLGDALRAPLPLAPATPERGTRS